MAIKTGNRAFGNYTEPYIIAEIGANHNGDVNLAKKMIEIAKEKGADCVEFQLRDWVLVLNPNTRIFLLEKLLKEILNMTK